VIEEIVRGILKDDAGIKALVSERIYADHIPQGGSLPAITLRGYGAARTYTFEGQCDLVRQRVYIGCWASTLSDARALAEAVRKACSGLQDVADGLLGMFCLSEDCYYDRAADMWHVATVYDILLREQ
jgi:hypothetical protein